MRDFLSDHWGVLKEAVFCGFLMLQLALLELMHGEVANPLLAGTSAALKAASGETMLVLVLVATAFYGAIAAVSPALVSLRRALLAMAWISLAAGVIDALGDELITTAAADPVAAAGAGLGVVFILAVVRYVIFPTSATIANAVAEQVARMHPPSVSGIAIAPPDVRGEHEIQRTAYHEAGHLLAHAAVSTLREGLSASIVPGKRHNGHVFMPGLKPSEAEQGFVLWHMHHLLMGQEAERKFADDVPMGSGGDISEWQQFARAVLTTQRYGTYYVNPASELEQSANDAVMRELMEGQLKVVHAALADCWSTVERCAEALLEHKTIDRDAIAALLEGVELPRSFPRVERIQVAGGGDQ